MKRLFSALACLAVLCLAPAAFASSICPTTGYTNTDCGYLITINADNSITGAPVAGANPYDGVEDALVGVVNKSSSTFTGSIHLTATGIDIFYFEGDGICTYTGDAYCSTAATGYEGPLNTFSNINNISFDSGDVNITGLAGLGGTTFFSLEEAPSSFGNSLVVGNVVPEPGTWALAGTGLLCLFGLIIFDRRRRVSRPMFNQTC
ncbi:MAG TPA: PEP-CTERM sorting domain-containing protein [Terracidiphilus sp.]|nr:PEP-CTERM sorting domain-containing protein [Terracidiphilus sp.]